MKTSFSKAEAEAKINSFFSKNEFNSKEVRKIKRLAMKHKIKLGSYRKQFCKKCLSQLKGKIRIKNGFKSIECSFCGFKNRWKLKPS